MLLLQYIWAAKVRLPLDGSEKFYLQHQDNKWLSWCLQPIDEMRIEDQSPNRSCNIAEQPMNIYAYKKIEWKVMPPMLHITKRSLYLHTRISDVFFRISSFISVGEKSLWEEVLLFAKWKLAASKCTLSNIALNFDCQRNPSN